MMDAGSKAPRYQETASSISALALFWETRLAEKSLRTKLGLDEDQWTAANKTDAEPLSVSLINKLVVKEGDKSRNLNDSELLLLKTSLSPFTPFADSWLSIDIKLPVLVSAVALFESFLADICGQFIAKRSDPASTQQKLLAIKDWRGWKEQLFEHGVLTEYTIGRAIDEKLVHIFDVKASIGQSEITDEVVMDTLSTINEMSTLIVRSSGWKLMTRMQVKQGEQE